MHEMSKPEISLASCDRCGQKTAANLLAPYTKSFHRGQMRICYNCATDAQRKGDWRLAQAFLAPILLLPVALFLSDSCFAFLAYVAFAVSVFLITVVPIHEFAHLVVARALGFDVPMLTFGAGDPLFEFRWFSLRIVVGSWIGWGGCWPAYRNGSPPLWKCFLVSAAGPLSNLLMAVLPGAVIVVAGGYRPMDVLGAVTVFVFLAGNLVYFLGSAIPRRRHGGNDAAHMVDCFRGQTRADQMHMGAYWIRADMKMRAGDFAAARSVVRQAKEKWPREASILWQDMLLAAREKDWAYVQSTLRVFVADEVSRDITWHIMPMLVLADLQTGTAAYLSEAESLSTRLIEAVPRLPIVMLARSMFLCSRGEYGGGLSMLTALANSYADPPIYAMAHLTLAQLHDRMGCHEQAARHRKHAHFFDPQNWVMPDMVPAVIFREPVSATIPAGGA